MKLDKFYPVEKPTLRQYLGRLFTAYRVSLENAWDKFDSRKLLHIANCFVCLPIYVATFVLESLIHGVNHVLRSHLSKVESYAFRHEDDEIANLHLANNRLIKEKMQLQKELQSFRN